MLAVSGAILPGTVFSCEKTDAVSINEPRRRAGVTAGQAWPGAMLMQKAKIKT